MGEFFHCRFTDMFDVEALLCDSGVNGIWRSSRSKESKFSLIRRQETEGGSDCRIKQVEGEDLLGIFKQNFLPHVPRAHFLRVFCWRIYCVCLVNDKFKYVSMTVISTVWWTLGRQGLYFIHYLNPHSM